MIRLAPILTSLVIASSPLFVSCEDKDGGVHSDSTKQPKTSNTTSSSNTPAAPKLVLAENRPIEFNRDIRPILSENCWGCHGADLHEAEAD